jgi:SNF2 family DNA or RNA helicase
MTTVDKFQVLIDNGGLSFHSYQYEGIQWCLNKEVNYDNNYNSVIKGGIVADEMGLGKTIVMIGLMYVNFVKKTLIVVPPILMEQWYNEIYRISGHKAFIYHGKTKKDLDLKKDSVLDAFNKAIIVITSYNIVSIQKKNNTRTKLNILHKIKWDRIIMDEAHHLRNKNTTRFLGCINLHAKYRWLLSGTPIQNKKSDFIHLCYILSPDFYISQKNKKNENTLEQNVNVNVNELEKIQIKKTDVIEFIKENHVLKRTKKNVGLELEDFQSNDNFVNWNSQDEKKFAQEIHSVVKVSKVANTDNQITTFAKQMSATLGGNGALIAVLRAKQTCIMPYLMKKTVQWLVDTNKINNDYLKPLSNQGSSKLEKVLEILLERKDNGKGKIIFCQFREEMNYIYEKCIENGFSSMIIDGRCSGKNRKESLKTAVDVLILQIQTGCEGLNLQENYSEVYFVSPNWNPSIEDQAIARCHRMGQKNIVQVFKFEMNGFDNENKTISLEKYINYIQNKKRNIRL